jgi:hypothetical protein
MLRRQRDWHVPDTTERPQPDVPTRIYLGCSAAFLGLFLLAGLAVLGVGLSGQSPNPGAAIGAGAVFTLAGLGGLALVRWAWGAAGRRERRRRMAPHQPWAWKGDVHAKVIRGQSPLLTVMVISAFAGIWLGMMAVITIGGWEKVRRETPLQAFMAVFWAAGLFLAWLAVHQILHARRFGSSSVVLDAAPAHLGGWLSGVVRAPRDLLGAEATLEVSCIETRRTSSDSGSSTWVRWRTTRVLDPAGFGLRAGHVEVPFAVRLPRTEEADGDELVGERIDWSVGISARLPGVDYSDRFDVPVAPFDEAAAADPARPPRDMPELSGEALSERLPGRVERDHRGEALVFPVKINWVLWILVFAAVAALPFLLPFLGLPQLAQLPPEVMRWGAIAGAVLFALSLLGLMLDTRRIEVTPDAVRIRRGVAGIGFHKTVPRRDVTGVEETTSRSNPPTYSVDIRLRDGKSCSAAMALREADQAAALADRLRRLLEMPG